ncbi:hypothetical protein J1N35_008307 [Gossypium stocksii]|uniref:Uncharacterized protein n=1 Tax=Gossypium stocksii TaxID=47602 RepID=A0A9D4AG00_9ROSI|nr:hypothetical protein J1N35_008307 [Gossypium stocksii]
MLRLFYKFSITSNLIKFSKMKLVDDEGVEIIIALYCSTGNVNVKPIQLFAKSTNVELVQNVIPLSQQYIVEDPCTEIHSVVVGADANGEEGPNNDGHSDHKGEDFSDPDLDEVLNDIDDEGTDEGENVYAPSVENLSRNIAMHNDPRAHILSVDPYVAHASEFPEYPDMIHFHWLMADFESE